MVKATMDIRLKAVTLYSEGTKTAAELGKLYGFSERSLRRWSKSFKDKGLEGLRPAKTGPKEASGRTEQSLVNRIIGIKGKYPAWGARRIKHQFNIPLHWTTVHDILKKNGLLFRIKAKPQPCKRFQRKHVDSMWQGDTFQFRIKGTGRVYVTGFTDDCSRYRIVSKAYLHKSKEEAINALWWALKKGRIPKQIYLDNGKQFIAKKFKREAGKRGIKLIFGRPHNPRGRGKIERYHKTLYRELIAMSRFRSLGHFRRDLWKFDKKYNEWRKHEPLGWQTPASVYNDAKYFNKGGKVIKKRPKTPLTKAARN